MRATESLDQYPGVDDWIVFEPSGRLRVRTGKVDIGQRISTALALIAAEELDVDYDLIDVDLIDTETALNEEYTSASNSMERSGQSLRLAAATARRRLLELAAEALESIPASLEVSDGLIHARPSNRTVSYWDLMAGKRFDIEVDDNVPVKPPKDYKQIGRSIRAKDIEALVSGTAEFVQDMAMPNMLHARVIRPPHYHARIAEIDSEINARMPGVQLVCNGSFIAVACEDEYRAVRAAESVGRAVRWTLEPGLDTRDIYTRLVTAPRISLPVNDEGAFEQEVPALGPPPAEATITLETRVERPYLMHGSIGPSAAVALFDKGMLTIWTHTQGVFPLRLTIAESLGIDPSTLRLVQRRGPGAYGHNGADDAALDAALIAMQIPGRPISLKWSREDEHAWEPFGSAMVVDVRASLDGKGNIIDWSHETYSDTHRTRPRPGPNKIGPARMLATHHIENPVAPFVPDPFLSGSLAGVHRGAMPYYNFPKKRVVKNLVRNMPLRTSTLRTLGSFSNVVAIETMMDQLAEAAGVDPVAFRLRQLDDPRARAVIEAVTQHTGWGRTEKIPGHGRGFGFARYNNRKAYAAVVADLEVNDAAEVKYGRITIAVDAGQIVDKDSIALQIEGGVLQTASWMIYEEVTYNEGGITSRDWETYPILRFDNVPDIETILIDRPGEPYLGPSECALSPTGGAIANAIYDAIGIRLKRMPFKPAAIRAAAMAS